MHKSPRALTATVALGAILTLGALALPQISTALAVERAILPEHNPPGDIPDSQVFIGYKGPAFSLQVPEGWSRTDLANGATFADKFNSLSITATDASAPPSITSVQQNEVGDFTKTGHAVAVSRVDAVTLKSGPAIRIEYQANSEPNGVTGKQIRLDCVRYLFFKSGKLVTLYMAAPAGADNVDQWLLMANSVALN